MTSIEQYQQFARTAKRLHSMAMVYRIWALTEPYENAERWTRYNENFARLARDARDFLMRARWLKSNCIERGEIHG